MKVKIINLDSRPDRWEEVTKEVERFGITEYERFAAHPGGYMGFNKSVHFVLENESEVLILEDDVIFDGKFFDILEAKAKLPDNWDLLYLGANVQNQQNRYCDGIWHLNNAWTSHAILYSDKGARYCYEHFPYEQGMIYDEWLRTVAQKQLNCFIVKPMIAFQRVGFSDIWGTMADYGIKGTEKWLI
jgi:GR25 family glycosyltransferase involved in LPS biosynthesis